MSQMISIGEAIQANNRVIGICVLVFVILSFIAWAFTVQRERRVKQLIRRAVEKAEAQAGKEYHEKAIENFMHWMDTRRELRKTKDELLAAQDEAADLRRKYDLLQRSVAGCPGVTGVKIIEN